MAMGTGGCALSPRLVAIPVFNPDAYDAGRASGRVTIEVVKILGFFIEGMQGQDVIGYLMHLSVGTAQRHEHHARRRLRRQHRAREVTACRFP